MLLLLRLHEQYGQTEHEFIRHPNWFLPLRTSLPIVLLWFLYSRISEPIPIFVFTQIYTFR